MRLAWLNALFEAPSPKDRQLRDFSKFDLGVCPGCRPLLAGAWGTARLNNRKIKDVLGGKPRMLAAEEVVAITGHPVGGVCRFGLATRLPVYCDLSLSAFDEILPAAGSANSALRVSP